MSRMRQAKAALLERLEEVVRELLGVPAGVGLRSPFAWKNPARADRKAGSFVVWLRGTARGAWKDYATGEQGDIVDLVCLAKGLSRRDALGWIEDRCGLRAMPAEERRALERQAMARRRREAEAAETADRRKIDRARKMFAQALPGGLEAPPVAAYLAARGIDVAALRFVEAEEFRFAPALEWWMGRTDGRPGPRFPALVSRMVDIDGVPKAVHCTFLSPDGSGKAPVEKPKLMWPATAGLVIRLSRGRGNRNAATAAALKKPGPCVLVEGTEDGFSVVYGAPEFRVWAAGSLPGLLSVPDHACVDSWIVVKDNDWGKPQAQALFERAIARLERTRKPVAVVASTAGKDVNDLLRGAA